MNIGKSLKVALAKRDMTQTQLAARIGKSFSLVNKLANANKANAQTIEMLAGALDMKVSEFIALGEE